MKRSSCLTEFAGGRSGQDRPKGEEREEISYKSRDRKGWRNRRTTSSIVREGIYERLGRGVPGGKNDSKKGGNLVKLSFTYGIKGEDAVIYFKKKKENLGIGNLQITSSSEEGKRVAMGEKTFKPNTGKKGQNEIPLVAY